MRFLEAHTADVMGLAFAPDGRRLATAGWDGYVCLWDLASGEVVRKLRTPNDRATAVAFSPDGQQLAAGFRQDGPSDSSRHGYGNLAWLPVVPRQGEPADLIQATDTRNAHASGTSGVAFFPDGQRLLTVGQDRGVRVWRGDLGHPIVFGLSYIYQSVVVRPDGQAVAAASLSTGRGLVVWDWPRVQDQPRQLQFPNDHCWALAYSPDGKTLVGGFDSGWVAWWRPGDDSQAVATGHKGAVRAVAFSPDGRLLLTGGVDGLIHLWDDVTGTRLATYDWQIGEIRCLAFAPDGLTAAAGGHGPVVLWDIDH